MDGLAVILTLGFLVGIIDGEAVGTKLGRLVGSKVGWWDEGSTVGWMVVGRFVKYIYPPSEVATWNNPSLDIAIVSQFCTDAVAAQVLPKSIEK